MTGWVDAHHHLWDLQAVEYPWLMARGEHRFFGDPNPIQRDYLLPEYRAEAQGHGFAASVHIQVGAADPWAEAVWVDQQAQGDWPLAQVVFCDLTAPDRDAQLDRLQTLPSVRGVRQIFGRAPGEDRATGTHGLLENPALLQGLRDLGDRGLSFDLQLIPELMPQTAALLAQAPDTRVALCHAGSPHDRSASGLQTWARSLENFANLPQVVCKLSGLGMFEHDWTPASFRPIVETCLAQFGADRVMFGSNFPVDKLTSDYGSLVEAYRSLIPLTQHPQVFSQTATRFYRLPQAPLR